MHLVGGKYEAPAWVAPDDGTDDGRPQYFPPCVRIVIVSLDRHRDSAIGAFVIDDVDVRRALVGLVGRSIVVVVSLLWHDSGF